MPNVRFDPPHPPAAGMPGIFSLPAKFQNARAGSTKKKI
jgi:hypothetical protein